MFPIIVVWHTNQYVMGCWLSPTEYTQIWRSRVLQCSDQRNSDQRNRDQRNRNQRNRDQRNGDQCNSELFGYIMGCNHFNSQLTGV